MLTFVMKNGKFVDKRTGDAMNDPAAAYVKPNIIVMPGMPTYQSPIDGRAINSRQERKDDLARNNCVEYEPSMSPTKGKFKNKRFTEKRGLTLSEEFRE